LTIAVSCEVCRWQVSHFDFAEFCAQPLGREMI
jgi:hypothetical protein